MTSVLKKSKCTKGKSESMVEDVQGRWPGDGSRVTVTEDVPKLIKYIDDNVIGKGNSFCGPHGRRKVVYCDYSGSGRALQYLEDHISRDVLPAHATRCTALSYTSGQCDVYRSESKSIIRAAVDACADDAVVLGASLTRFLRALRPGGAVFVSSRETERQIAPWREWGAEIIKIPETKEGFIDLNNLELKLQQTKGTFATMIGFFPAASKLTGALADDVATTLLLHQYGALAFWDYTLVAPSSAVDMNPTFPGVEEEMVKKDAVFFNCEKFVGGVQGPYVAVVKKEVFRDTALYSDDVEVLSERIEECRTTETVRAALVMQLRDAVGLQNIAARQDRIAKQVLSHIKNIPELILLGSESPTVRRLPIFSLMVKHPRGTFLHHNFVCAVLNDVFGIQARGGLNSHLNYGHDILGIDEKLLREYDKLLDVEMQKEVARVRKMSSASSPDTPIHNEHLRPGFCRVSLPFFMSESELAFVLEALKMVATEGWKILPQYVVNAETGQWKHHSSSVLRDRKSLYSLRFHDGKMTANERRLSGPGIFPQTYTECLQTARNLFNRARKLAMKCSTAEPAVGFNPRIDYLRWFMLPKEAHDLLLGRSANVKHIVPFDPSGYTGARKSLHNSRGYMTSSPILGSSSRHFSLSAIDDCQAFRLKQKQMFFTRETSLKEVQKEESFTGMSYPVQFSIGEYDDLPVRLDLKVLRQPLLVRSRCYSLGSDNPSTQLSAQTKLNLGLKESSPNSIIEKTSSFCNCGSQTDLQSLDDPMISPEKAFLYSQSNTSTSDCSQVGRVSPATSLTSSTSEDINAYVKEMTREIATEIKSEIREVISKVDDILENSEALEQLNLSLNSLSSQSDSSSVSVVDVAAYLTGISRGLASEVKHEIREMVNQVDGMVTPGYAGSRKSSPPQSARLGSGTDLELELSRVFREPSLKKCSTTPLFANLDEEDRYTKSSPSPKPVRTSSHESSERNSISFNSSETSTPDTIIQMVASSLDSPNLPKSLSSNKLSDDEICGDLTCRHCCVKKPWCPTGSSQDSGINMSFGETDAYLAKDLDFVKWRTSSDPTTNKARKLQGRLRTCSKHDKGEVPDIIEGVPCDQTRQFTQQRQYSDSSRVLFQVPDEAERPTTHYVRSAQSSKRSSRSSLASRCSENSSSSRSSGYGTDASRPSREELYFVTEPETAEEDVFKGECCWEETERDDSSACSDGSLTDFTMDDEGKWHCPPKTVWKSTVEAIHEYGMIRAGDKVLVCLSGGRESIALLHTLHQYQFYSRAKGMHFTIGALFVHAPRSEVDPLHLMAYCRTLGVKLIYQDQLEGEERRSSASKPPSLHRWASHAVRRRAYVAAAQHGYTVAAVAQHLDHAARAFIASAFHGGALTAVKAHYRVREHDLRIIRPFVYVRERDLDAFASARMLPDFRGDAKMADMNIRAESVSGDNSPEQSDESGSEACKELARSLSAPCAARPPRSPRAPRRAPRRRQRSLPLGCAGDVLASQERAHPYLFASLKSALHPLISSRNIDKQLKEHRHRKKSVIQMKNGAPVYDSDEGTEEEPMP